MPLEPAEEAYEGVGMLLEDLGRGLIEIASKIDEDWLTSSSSSIADDDTSEEEEKEQNDDD